MVPTGEALRASTTSASMRIVWSRVVTPLAAAIGISRIPTGALRTVPVTAMHDATLSRMVSSTTVSATMWIGIPAGDALRTSIATAAVRVLCIRVVLSTSAVGVSRIPTG